MQYEKEVAIKKFLLKIKPYVSSSHLYEIKELFHTSFTNDAISDSILTDHFLLLYGLSSRNIIEFRSIYLKK
jgi:hypothetical protein